MAFFAKWQDISIEKRVKYFIIIILFYFLNQILTWTS